MSTPRRWLLSLQIPALLTAGVFFLSLYNRFILNANLQNLKTSLSILDTATGVGQAETALLLVDQTLVAEMAKEEVDLKNLATLQYIQGALSSDQLQRPVEDAQVLVASLVEDQSATRSGLLATLDGVAAGVQSFLNRTSILPRQMAGKSLNRKIDTGQLRQAAQLERVGLFAQAAKIYEKLLKEYPDYAGRTVLKMRLGYAYQNSHALDQAEQMYREAILETANPQEVGAARQTLAQLNRVKRLEWKSKDMERQLETLKLGPERQQLAFQLGSTFIELYDMNKAARAFHEAILADPKGELALPALFKEGWCLRTSGRLEEALERFQEIIRRYPKGAWATVASQQIAESYRATGDYDTAAQTYEQTILKAEDAAYASILHNFTGSMELYDLKNPDKAQQYFQALATNFPASPLSGMEHKMQQLRVEKGEAALNIKTNPAQGVHPTPVLQTKPLEPQETTLSLGVGTPVMKWLEGFLPVFVEVFEDRLSRYMQATGTPVLTRRYSEQEFQELVLRRVQQRFPGQVKEVKVKIQPDGFVGSGKVQLGMLSFPLEARIGVVVKDEVPNAVIQEVKVGNLVVPEMLLKILEERANQAIAQGKYPLRIKQYELKEGYALISAELTEKDGHARDAGNQILFRH